MSSPSLHILGGPQFVVLPIGGFAVSGFVDPPVPPGGGGGNGKGPPGADKKNRLRVAFAGSADLYTVGYAPGSPDTVHVFKSSDDGATWAIQDSGNAPTVTSVQAVAVHTLDSTHIGVAVASEPSAGNQTTTLIVFDTSGDTWGSAITVESAQARASGQVWGISLAAHTNGDAAIVTHTARVDADTSLLKYFRVTQAGSTDASETFAGTSYSGQTPAVVVGSDNDVHVLFRAPEAATPRLYYNHRPDAGTFAGPSALTFDGLVGHGDQYSGTGVAFGGSTAAGKMFVLTADTTGSKTEYTSTVNVRGTLGEAAQVSVATKGATLHLVYASSKGGKMSRATFDGSTIADVGIVSSGVRAEVLGVSVSGSTLYVVWVKPGASEEEDIYTAKIALPTTPFSPWEDNWTDYAEDWSAWSTLHIAQQEAQTEESNRFETSPYTGGAFAGAVLAPNGNIYFIPYANDFVGKLDPDTETFSEVGTTVGSQGTVRWLGGALAPNGKIYAPPYQSANILVIDPTTDDNTQVAVGGSPSYAGAVCGPNGFIYGIPYSDTTFIKIDPSDDSFQELGTIAAGTGKWVGGVLAPNGCIYGVPRASTSVLKIDTSDDSVTTFGSFSTASKWSGGALAPNGKIYCVPQNNEDVLVIDPSDDSTTTIGTLTAGSNHYAGAVLGSNGKIYGIPRTDTNVLVIDPSDDSVTEWAAGLTGSEKWYGGCLAPNGRIYGAGFFSGDFLRLLSSRSSALPDDMVLSRYINKSP